MRGAVLAGAIVLAAAVASGAADHEVPRDRSARDIPLAPPLQGPAYRVRDLVPSDGYSNRWTVDSDFGAFEATGDGALRKLIGEIRAIGELRRFSRTKAFTKGLGTATKAPLAFAKSLVTHPVDTVSGVPKGTWQVVENVGVSVTTTRNPAEDSRAAQVLKMSSYKRDLGDKLNVDVYSSNKVLQTELNRVAWAMSVGDMAFSVAMMPAGAGGSLVSTVRLGNSIKNVLKEEPPQRLRIVNDETLTRMGIPEDLRTRFLDHPAFTPRQATIICANLDALAGAAGREAFVGVALRAQDEADANLYTAMAQLLRGYHQAVAPLTRLAPLNRLVVASTQAGPTVVALPADQLLWTERVDEISGFLQREHGGANGRIELWLTGTASKTARQQLEARGFSVADNAGRRVEVLD